MASYDMASTIHKALEPGAGGGGCAFARAPRQSSNLASLAEGALSDEEGSHHGRALQDDPRLTPG
jgi:hypothetical protein